MKTNKLFALLLMTICMGLMACGGDSDDPIENPTQNPTPDPTPNNIALTAENIAKYVSATISYNSDEELYTANIQSALANSPLASKIAGKEVKYYLKVYIVMKDWLKNNYSDDYEDFSIHYIELSDNPAYATGTNNSYVLSVKNPAYFGIKAIYRHSSKYKEEWLDECESDSHLWDCAIWMQRIKAIEKRINEGQATENEYKVLEEYRANYNYLCNEHVSYSRQLYTGCSSIAKVYIEIDGKTYSTIDGKTYLIQEKTDGPIHLLTYGEWADGATVKTK